MAAAYVAVPVCVSEARPSVSLMIVRNAAGALPVGRGTGQILLALRSKHVDHPGCWSSVGGFLHGDESHLSAAKRELLEETACCATNWSYLATRLTDGVLYTTFACLMDASQAVKPDPLFSWENQAFRWFELDEAMAMLRTTPLLLHPGLRAFLRNDPGQLSSVLMLQRGSLRCSAKQ